MKKAVEILKWDKPSALMRAADDEGLLIELLALLVDATEQSLAEIKASLASGDAASVMGSAHSIKGSAANLSVEAIRELALEMEAAGRADDLAAVEKMIPRMERLIDQLKILVAALN